VLFLPAPNVLMQLGKAEFPGDAGTWIRYVRRAKPGILTESMPDVCMWGMHVEDSRGPPAESEH
jgi:hypothetical protein